MENDDLLIDSVICDKVTTNDELLVETEATEPVAIVEDTKKKNKKNKKSKSKIIEEVSKEETVLDEPIEVEPLFIEEESVKEKEPVKIVKHIKEKPQSKKLSKFKKYKLLKGGKRTIKSYNYPTTAKFKRNKSVNKSSISTSFKILSSGSIRI